MERAELAWRLLVGTEGDDEVCSVMQLVELTGKFVRVDLVQFQKAFMIYAKKA